MSSYWQSRGSRVNIVLVLKFNFLIKYVITYHTWSSRLHACCSFPYIILLYIKVCCWNVILPFNRLKYAAYLCSYCISLSNYNYLLQNGITFILHYLVSPQCPRLNYNKFWVIYLHWLLLFYSKTKRDGGKYLLPGQWIWKSLPVSSQHNRKWTCIWNLQQEKLLKPN